MTTDNNQELATDHDKPASIPNAASLNPYQLGAYIRNHRLSPLQRIPEDQRAQWMRDILDRNLNGERLEDIAAQIGVHRTALNQYLLKYAEEEWKSVQIARALTLVDDSEGMIDAAQDQLALNRAREKLATAKWQLERLLRRLYGDSIPERGGSGTININIGIERNAQVTIDHESE